MGHELVDVVSGSVVSVLGRNCWYENQWHEFTVGVSSGMSGFVKPGSGSPYTLIRRKTDTGYMISLAKLNDTGAPGSVIFCKVESLIDVISGEGNHQADLSAYDPSTDRYHVLAGQLSGSTFRLQSLVNVDLSTKQVRSAKLTWPHQFRGGPRQLVYHTQ